MSKPEYTLFDDVIQPQPSGGITPPDTSPSKLVFEAFQHAAVTGSHQDPHAIVKDALTHLRNHLVGPWLPEHKNIRESILWIIASPTEAIELATTLISHNGGPKEVNHDLSR